jgi:hypothetical protein
MNIDDLSMLTLEQLREKLVVANRVVSEATSCLPFIATSLTRLEYEQRKLEADNAIDAKTQHSARKLAKDYAAEIAELKGKLLLIENRVEFYESMFPWIVDYVGCDLVDLLDAKKQELTEVPNDSNDDAARRLVSASEWAALSDAARNQRALDNWRTSRRSSPWHAGRDYERFIGWELESQGFKVRYSGIEDGLEDRGRDLVATKEEFTLIVQCKYWKNTKTVHEKHIFMLFGTAVQYLENECSQTLFGQLPIKTVRDLFQSRRCSPRLVTSAGISSYAQDCADLLGVEVQSKYPMSRDYPIIKCNISKHTGDRIYHLPFDQQYDATRIDLTAGEFYAKDVVEAENAGFRRAWRYNFR